MSSSCPNKSHPAWKALVEKTGSEIGAYKQYINNNFSIPSIESSGEEKEIKPGVEFFQLNKVSVPQFIFEEQEKMKIYGITSNQKSRIPLINKLLYRAISPANYNKTRILKKSLVSLFVGRDYKDFINTIKKWREEDLKNNIDEKNKAIPKWATEITEEQYKKREDAWALSNGLPQKNNTFKYIGRGYVRNGEVIFDNSGEDIYNFNDFSFNGNDLDRWLADKRKAVGIDKKNAVMGEYVIKIGRDNVGYYLKYSDRWDLDINTNIIKKIINATQKPFIVTGKLYKAASYDDYGNIFIYYTQDVVNPDIKLYNDFLKEMNEEEEIEQAKQERNEETTSPLLQLKGETESSKASPKTVAVVKDFLKRIGVDIKSLTGIVVNGVKQDANGAALIMQKIVQVVEGKEDVALTEEAMHFAVEILKQTNPKLYKQLLKEINSYNLYAQVLRDYSSNPLYQTKDGKPDIQKLKDEAIAKVLTEKIINKSEGQTEKPDLLQKSEGWWKSIITWFKELFSNSGFDRATMDILSGKDIGTAEDIIAEDNKVYLQKTKQDLSIEEMLRVDKSITKKETGKTIDGKKEEAYFIDGRQIKKRVTEIIKDWYKGIFRDSNILESDYNKSVNDLKAEKGTAGHADLEYAFSRFVDENGYLRDVELKDDVDFQSKIDPTNNDMYYTLKDNLRERLKSFPEGTRFFKEMQVYDAKRDVAGTIDFLAIEKDGKVNLLDWKFMNLNLEKYTDVPWYKINAWNQQMAQYKLILINSYGFKSQDFKQTRMIPIIANYSKGSARQNILPKLKSIEIGDQNVQNIQKDYLLPVALVEETTGDKKFDKLISELTSIYKEMSQKRIVNEEEKKNKAEQLNALFKAMRQLQIKQNIFPLVEQAKVLALEVERVIAEYKQKFEGKDASLFTEEERDEYSKKLTEMSTALAVYTDLSANLSFLFKNRILSEEDKELRNLLRQTSADAQDLKTALSDIDEEFVVEHIGKSEGEKDISLKEKTIRGASKWFSSTVTTQLSSLRVLYRKVNRQLFNASQEAVDESVKLETKKQKYDEWARSKGLSAKNYFNIIKKKNSNELIDEWYPEFFKILKEAITNKEAEDYKWIAENIDIDAYRDHLAKKLEDELIRIDNKVRLITDENREFVEFEIEQEKQKARNIYTIDKPTSPGFLLYSDIKKFPLKKWHSPEWKTLTSPGNEAAKDFYDYIIEKNKEYAEIGYISKSEARVFLPWVRKSLTEKLIFGGKISLGEQFLKSISVDDGVTGYGQINPITGKLIDKIPKYLISEIEDVADVSEELFKTMSLYNDFALKFKYLSQIENQAQAIIRLERNKKSIRTSKWGNAVMVNGEIDENPDNSENAQLIEDTMKGIMYGQKYLESETFDQLYGKISNFGEKFNKKLGMKIFPENLGERSLSINRTIDQLNKVFQLRTLGLNPLSSISNFLGGSFQSIINAGKYFTKSDFVATEMWLFGEKMKQHAGMYPEKTLAAFEYFLPLTENYNREISKKLALNKLNQENIQDFLMMLMRNSDMAVQTTNFFTYLKNSVIINGEIVNVREYLKTTPEYFDIYKGSKEQRIALQKKFEEDVKKLVKEKGVLELSEVKNGKLVIPGITRKDESVVDLRRKVQNLNRAALGNIGEDEIRKINQNIYGKSFMVFKNWIPQLVATRTANLQFNNASDAYEWGRLRMVFRILKEDGIKSLKTIIDTYQGNESAIARIRELYEKKKNEYEDETGKEFKMTQGEFIELVRQNIKNAITDGLITLTLLGLLISLKANAPDDDDDEIIKNQYKFLLKATDKITDELLYFYDPRNLLYLLKGGLFPSSSLIENYIKILENFSVEMFALGTGDEKLQEKTKVLKYVMKSFPIMYQMEQMLPMFYPEMAKDLGITMSSEAKPKI